MRTKVDAEVLDLKHGLLFVPPAKVDGSDDVEVLHGSDVVVMSASAKQKPGQTRMDLAEANAEICRKILPEVARIAPDALLLTSGSIPLSQWSVQGHRRLTAVDKDAIVKNVKEAAHQVIQGRGATNYAVGLAGVQHPRSDSVR